MVLGLVDLLQHRETFGGLALVALLQEGLKDGANFVDFLLGESRHAAAGACSTAQGQQATVNTTAQRSLIERLINTIEYRRVEQTQRGDTAVIRYELQSVTDVQNLTQTSTATVENATSTLVIDENGVIRELQLNAQFRTDRRTLRIRFATNYTQLGETTVSEPNWTDDAREASKTT